jgi:hypothetical protein
MAFPAPERTEPGGARCGITGNILLLTVAGVIVRGSDTCQPRVCPRLRGEAHIEHSIRWLIDVAVLLSPRQRRLVPFLSFQPVVTHRGPQRRVEEETSISSRILFR